MKEFALLFRQPSFDRSKMTQEQIEATAKKWAQWSGGIAAQGKLSTPGNKLVPQGKVLKSGGVITDGPFVEIREMLGGFVIVKVENEEEAITLAHGCPVLENGGSVEIRPVDRN